MEFGSLSSERNFKSCDELCFFNHISERLEVSLFFALDGIFQSDHLKNHQRGKDSLPWDPTILSHGHYHVEGV